MSSHLAVLFVVDPVEARCICADLHQIKVPHFTLLINIQAVIVILHCYPLPYGFFISSALTCLEKATVPSSFVTRHKTNDAFLFVCGKLHQIILL